MVPFSFQLGIAVGPSATPKPEKPPAGGVSKSPLISRPTNHQNNTKEYNTFMGPKTPCILEKRRVIHALDMRKS